MIPRTTIDEANKHIMGLHKKVHELESFVKEQHAALQSKDDCLGEKLSELSSAKDTEIGFLQEKLQSKERTVTILQEQMSQKNQQIAVLQRNFRVLRKVLSFKTDLTDLLATICEAEECSKNSMDWIDEEYFYDEKSAEGDSGMGTSIQLFNSGTATAILDEMHDINTNNSPSRGKHTRRTSKGREFYL